MEETLRIASLIGTLSTIILGIIAIWLSLYFYKRGTELHILVTKILSRIEASTKATEVASRDVLHPTIQGLLEMIRRSTDVRIESIGHTFTQRFATKLDQVVKARSHEEKEAARGEFLEEMNSLLGTLRHEVGKVVLAIEPEVTATAGTPTTAQAMPVPGSTSYNWLPFIRKIHNLEATKEFLAAKWLRETVFAKDPEAQEALQIAIDRSMLSTYHRNNPKNPQFPTLCCKLNLDHLLVKEIVQAIEQG